MRNVETEEFLVPRGWQRLLDAVLTNRSPCYVAVPHGADPDLGNECPVGIEGESPPESSPAIPDRYQYFLDADGRDGIWRLAPGDPLRLAQSYSWRQGLWTRSETLWRENFLGSGSADPKEVPTERAREHMVQTLAQWAHLSLPAPAALPGDPDRKPELSGEARRAHADLRSRLKVSEAALTRRWAAVPRPPDVEKLTDAYLRDLDPGS